MSREAWTRHEKRWRRRQVPFARARSGTARSLESHEQIVQVRHVLGFAREDWGEANWTSKDLR